MVAAINADPTPAISAGLRFTVGSRPQKRFANVQTIQPLTAGSLAPIQLPASGHVRKIRLDVTLTGTFASAGAAVLGDSPWNIISGITLTDATGQPVQQPVSGFEQYLLNKFFSSGGVSQNALRPFDCPQLTSDYRNTVTSTAIDVHFALDLDIEQDWNSGYGCIPNLDSNASLQLKIDYNPYTVVATGTTPSNIFLTVRVSQYYWAPVGKEVNGVPLNDTPPGFGDYLEIKRETQTVSASTENLVTLTSRGGLVKGVIMISRNAGARTDWTANSNVGTLLDNNPIDEGVTYAEFQDEVRREYGYIGADLTNNYAPLTPGVLPGLDRGVLVNNFAAKSGGRDSWLSTRTGSLLQMKVNPGAGATTLEILTLLMQVRDANTFYAPSSLT